MNAPIAILGPTASGKSNLALDLASAIGGEILSCDSVQFYRGFDIGSAKPTREDRQRVPHHMIDVLDADEEFDAFRYAEAAKIIIAEIQSRSRTPILCGGTGLYFRALCRDRFHEGLPANLVLRRKLQGWDQARLVRFLQRVDPLRSQSIHPNDRYRLIRAIEVRLLLGKEALMPPTTEQNPFFTVICDWPREIIRQRIGVRTSAMFDAGLVEEVKSLLASGVAPHAKPMQSIGYKQVVEMLKGQMSESECRERVFFATCQYAKRQQNWFRTVSAHVRTNVFEQTMEEYLKWKNGSTGVSYVQSL